LSILTCYGKRKHQDVLQSSTVIFGVALKKKSPFKEGRKLKQ
jgi:hypothetical protein